MKLPFSIAIGFLKYSKAQSIFICIGIGIGLSVLLFLGILISSLQLGLIESTVGSSAHITISNDDKNFILDQKDIDEIKSNKDVTKVQPVLRQNVLIDFDGGENAILLSGIEFTNDNDIYKLSDKLIEGNLPSSDDEILVGNFYDLKVGDKVTISTIDFGEKEYTVSGIVDQMNETLNEKSMYVTLNSLQEYMDSPNYVSAIELQINDIFTSNQVKSNLDISYEVVTWEETNKSLLQALNSQSSSSYIIQVFVVISVTLAIASVLVINTVQKSKQIGILKAMGLKNSSISYVMFAQGIIFGFVGSVFGLILGISLLLTFSKFAVNSDGDAIINIVISPMYIVLTFVVGMSSAIVASLVPARKSRRLSAVEVINNG